MELTLYPCWTFRQRLFGVHGFGTLAENQGLWIFPCRAVHTLGLAQVLDVVFLDAGDRPLRVCAGLAPNRSAWCWRAISVVELPAGFCQCHADYVAQIVHACRTLRQLLQTGSGGCLPARRKR